MEQADEEDHNIDVAALKKLLLSLREKCIQIIELLYFRGYTQKQASEALKIPLGTVKTRNRNCIQKLRENITLEWT